MSEWKSDKAWADKFMHEIKQILGVHLIKDAPYEEDAKRNSDLIVLRLESVRIAVRTRRFYNPKTRKPTNYLSKWGHQFTIRADRPNGARTEFSKIIEGWGDYFFYGFADETETVLAKWTLGRLSSLRLHLAKLVWDGKKPDPIQNYDDSSSFYAFNVADVRDFVVASSDGIPS